MYVYLHRADEDRRELLDALEALSERLRVRRVRQLGGARRYLRELHYRVLIITVEKY